MWLQHYLSQARVYRDESSIEPVHSGPAVEPVAYIRGNAVFPCDANQARHKAAIAVAVDRRRKPQNRCPDSMCRQRKRRRLRFAGEVVVRLLAARAQGPDAECEKRFDQNGEDWVMRHCYRGRNRFRLREMLHRATPIHADQENTIFNASTVANHIRSWCFQ